MPNIDIPHKTLADALQAHAQARPDQVAYHFLTSGETLTDSLTYQQLHQAAQNLAAHLQARGVQAGDRVLLLQPQNLLYVVALFACFYAGVIAVPAYPPRKNKVDARLRAIAQDCQAAILLGEADAFAHLHADSGLNKTPFLALDTLDRSALPACATKRCRAPYLAPQDFVAPPVAPSDVAFLQYTSGSTGSPKGVMVTHEALAYNVLDMNAAVPADADSVMVSWLPLFHDMGLVYGAMLPLYYHFPCYLMPPAAFTQQPFRWLNALSVYHATHSAAPNFAYEACTQKISDPQIQSVDLTRCRYLVNGSERVRFATLENFIRRFAPTGLKPEALAIGYGMAETVLKTTASFEHQRVTALRLSASALQQHQMRILPDSAPSSADDLYVVNCGRSALNTRVRIVDPHTLMPCAADQIGEVWVSGITVAKGYWARPDATQETFRATLPDEPDGTFFLRTGDLGFLHEGDLYVTGRIKEVLIIRGQNYYPQDLEQTVQQAHPALRRDGGAAFSINVADAEVLVVIQEVEREALRRLQPEQVLLAVRQAIAEQHGIQLYALMLIKPNSLPRTSSGKNQRGLCRAQFLAGEWAQQVVWHNVPHDIETPAVAPQAASIPLSAAALQSWMQQRLAAVLRVPLSSIDPTLPMTAFGLDSVTAVSLSGELATKLETQVSPTLLYDYPTIQGLAEYLALGAANLGAAALGAADFQVSQNGGAANLEISHSQVSQNAACGGEANLEISHSQPSDSQSSHAQPIAIISLACRFPAANNLSAFLQNLRNGVDAIREIPPQRWQAGNTPAQRWGGFIDDIDLFDAAFFGIAPKEANRLDPQQRLLLETAWRLFENAGIDPQRLAGSLSGVFIGISASDYQRQQIRQGIAPDVYYATGNALCIAANRLSYTWDLRGPSLAIDTACSSSLVAVHQACASLNSGACDLALAGGVNLMLEADLHDTFSQAGMLSPDGRCKTFDAQANGYVRGEGCGLVLLKRLSDAQRDGDDILALIRGGAINQDGRSNGLTAPNSHAQQAVIRAALRNAGVSAAEIGYIEAHGTGTSLGDPIEFNAVKAVLKDAPRDTACLLGSVKTNIGHLEAAAGVAGLIKTVLSLQHGEIFPHLHYQTPNPLLEQEDSLLKVAQAGVWQGKNRYAGISGFGFGGTNVHLILEAAHLGAAHLGAANLQISPAAAGGVLADLGVANLQISPAAAGGVLADLGAANLQISPAAAGGVLADLEVSHSQQSDSQQSDSQQSDSQQNDSQLLPISAKTPEALQQLARDYIAYLQANPDISLSDIAYSAQQHRAHFRHRLSLVADTHATAIEKLTQLPADLTGFQNLSGLYLGKAAVQAAPVVFLFTGQGAQYAGMGRDLYDHCPLFKEIIDECDQLARPHLQIPLLSVMYPNENEDSELINQTQYTQPALFALEIATARLWMAAGIEPAAVIGHSIGEYAAACIAGVMSLQDGLLLVIERARLMAACAANGGMATVFADSDTVREALKPYPQLSIATLNSPRNTVVSGDSQALQAFLADFAQTHKRVETRALVVSNAFHSALMQPMLDEFEQRAAQLNYQTPRIPLISNLSGQAIEKIDAHYWRRHTREAVNFLGGMQTLLGQGYAHFIEVGPRPVLCSLGEEIAAHQPICWLPSLHAKKNGLQVWLGSLAQLYVQGVANLGAANLGVANLQISPAAAGGVLADLEVSHSQPSHSQPSHSQQSHSQPSPQHRRVNLPPYPFQPQRYWLTNLPMQQSAPSNLSTSQEPQSMMNTQTSPTASASILAELIRLTAEVLEVSENRIEVDVSLLEMGADSLVIAQVVRKIEAKYGLNLSMSQFFAELNNLTALAAYVEANRGAADLGAADLGAADFQVSQNAAAGGGANLEISRSQVSQNAAAGGGANLEISHSQVSQNAAAGGAANLEISHSQVSPSQQSHPQVPQVMSQLERILNQQMMVVSNTLTQVVAQQLAVLGGADLGAANLGAANLGAADLGAADFQVSQNAAGGGEANLEISRSQVSQNAAGGGGANLEISHSQVSHSQQSRSQQSHPQVNEEKPSALPAWKPKETQLRGMTAQQQAYMAAFIERYTRKTPGSKQLTQQYRQVLSDSRASAGFRLSVKEMVYPIIGDRARGSRTWDVDGNEYIDITMGFGVNLFGHQPPFVIEAIEKQLHKTMQLGLQTPLAGEVARLIGELTGLERVTFCNSGTEAVMTALRLARAATRKTKVVSFIMAYHGHFDGVLAEPEEQGSVPAAPGVCPGMVQDIFPLKYDDPASLDYIRAHAHELAAVLVEPVQSRHPEIQPRAFLQELRNITRSAGVVFILDEMITGFRVHPGGAQAWFGVDADIATYGKIVGGGMPIGVVAGKARFMDGIDGGFWSYGDNSYPQADTTFFAGTFCKHPLAMAAAKAVLLEIKQQGAALQENLNARTAAFAKRLNDWFNAGKVPLQILHFGSLFRFAYTGNLDMLYYHLVEKGLYVWEGRNCFLSTAHSDADIEVIISKIQESVHDLHAGGFLPDAYPQPIDARAKPQTFTYPLTATQQHFWAMCKGNPSAVQSYIATLLLHVAGEVKLDYVEQIAEQLMQRHQSLRMLIDAQSEQAVVLARVKPSVLYGEADNYDALIAWLEQQASFDLHQGPLWRWCLVRATSGEHWLALQMQHIVSDGISMSVLLEEFALLYNAKARGETVTLPPAAQWQDFSRYKADYAHSPQRAEDVAFYTEQLNSGAKSAGLSEDFPRPDIFPHLGNRYEVKLSPAVFAQLKHSAQQQQATPFMFLAASVSLLFHLLNGDTPDSTPQMLAFPVSGRFFQNSDHLTGNAAHPLLLITRLPAQATTFADYLRYVRGQLLQLYRHQALSARDLAQEMRKANVPFQMPSIRFNYDRPQALSALNGAAVSYQPMPLHSMTMDLFIDVMEWQDTWQIRFEYMADVFSAEHIEQLAAQFTRLLDNASKNENVLISNL